MTQSASFDNDMGAATRQYVDVSHQNKTATFAPDTGTANTYVVAVVPAPNVVVGTTVQFTALNANTGASTLALNGGTAAAIKKRGNTALASGDISAGQVVEVVWDGTNWQKISEGGNSVGNLTQLTVAGGTLAGNSTPNTITQTWNNANTTFHAFTETITNTASAAGSTLMDLVVGSTTMFQVDEAGNVYLGNSNAGLANLATTATTGFPNMPMCAGAPTGNLTALPRNGQGAFVYDITDHKICVNEGNATWVKTGALS